MRQLTLGLLADLGVETLPSTPVTQGQAAVAVAEPIDGFTAFSEEDDDEAPVEAEPIRVAPEPLSAPRWGERDARGHVSDLAVIVDRATRDLAAWAAKIDPRFREETLDYAKNIMLTGAQVFLTHLPKSVEERRASFAVVSVSPPPPAATPAVMTEAVRDARVLALLQELAPLLVWYGHGPRNSSLTKLAFIVPTCVKAVQRKRRLT